MVNMETINLVILNDSNPNQYIPLLRKKTSKSISDLRKNISLEKPVIESDYYDAEELKNLVKVAEDLLSLGANIKIFEDKEEITIDMVKNLIDTIEGVAKDRENIDKLMFDNE